MAQLTTKAKVCDACHNPVGWQAWTFDHDVQTDFPLTGGHADVAAHATAWATAAPPWWADAVVLWWVATGELRSGAGAAAVGWRPSGDGDPHAGVCGAATIGSSITVMTPS